MKEKLDQIHSTALAELDSASSEALVEDLRIKYLGRKGVLTEIVRGLRDVAPEERPRMGAYINEIKQDLEGRLDESLKALRAKELEQQISLEQIDVTVPGRERLRGRLHPITQTMDEVVRIFVGLGFEVAEGPDIEDDYHNFTALNFPADHPARDMQDTFFVDETHLLRTHTSPVQIRVMESRQAPLRFVVPGTTYRHDSDTTHSPMFHQVEGFMVDRRITFGDLKGVLTLAMQRIFSPDTRLRFRASFFPFTEPSAEIDISCQVCGGHDNACRICRGSGWLEILGAGMIDPNVFKAVGYDPEEVSGFAFGMGIERITILKHHINDIRLFYSNDNRFLRQF